MCPAAVALELDGEALGLAKIRRYIDIVLRISGWASKEIWRAFVSEGVVYSNGKILVWFLALITLDLCGRWFCVISQCVVTFAIYMSLLACHYTPKAM